MSRIIKVYNVWDGSASSHEFDDVESALRFLDDMGFELAPDTPMTALEEDDNGEVVSCTAYWFAEPEKTVESYGDGYEPRLILDDKTAKKYGW